MNKAIRTKLFIMMVLEFFIWGAWLPKIFGYLPAMGFTDNQQLAILLAFPVAAIVGMFFSNEFADRHFAAEKFMAFSHLVGGLAILSLGFLNPASATNPAPFWAFFILMSVHCLFYVPTMSIANTLAFANTKDATKDFGLIRMGGTIGWILAAWPFIFLLVDWDKVAAANTTGFVNWLGTAFASPMEGAKLITGTRWTFYVAGIASLALAAFSLTLPNTPPKKGTPGDSLAMVKAFKVLKHPVILVLWVVTLIDSFVHNTYFFHTDNFLKSASVGIGANWTQAVMSVGQVAEILTMIVLGATLKKLGWKITMLVGIAGHALRFGVYSFLPEQQWLMITVQLIHGICYAFYFATVYIFVEKAFPNDIRTSAQGLFNLMIFGLGDILAKVFWIFYGNKMFTQADGGMDWRNLFLVPAGLAIVAMVLLAVAFHPPKNVEEGTGGSAPAH
jgi:predicted MFS family arabinose efflux permease